MNLKRIKLRCIKGNHPAGFFDVGSVYIGKDGGLYTIAVRDNKKERKQFNLNPNSYHYLYNWFEEVKEDGI